MASNRKAQKETDQAIRHLMDYVCETSPWDHLFDELMIQFIEPVATHLQRETEDVRDELLDGPHHSTAWGFLFEEMVSVEWHNEGNATATYLKQRGWREGTHGKSYLRALANSSVKLWDITDVSPGEWIDLRLYGTSKKPKRVHEHSASQQLVPGECLAARVMLLGKLRGLSGAPLLLTADTARQIQSRLNDVPGETEANYQQMVKDGELQPADVPGDLTEEVKNEQEELLVNLAFGMWATTNLLQATPTNFPELRNANDEHIVFLSLIHI